MGTLYVAVDTHRAVDTSRSQSDRVLPETANASMPPVALTIVAVVGGGAGNVNHVDPGPATLRAAPAWWPWPVTTTSVPALPMAVAST